MKLTVVIHYSRDTMDSWEDGRELKFSVESSYKLDSSKIGDLVDAYMKATGISYRELQYKIV